MASLFDRFSALVTAMVLAMVATAFAVFPVMFVPSLQLPAARILCDGAAKLVELPAPAADAGERARREVRCAAEPGRDITKGAMGLTFFGAWAAMTLALFSLFAYREFKNTRQSPPPDEGRPSG